MAELIVAGEGLALRCPVPSAFHPRTSEEGVCAGFPQLNSRVSKIVGLKSTTAVFISGIFCQGFISLAEQDGQYGFLPGDFRVGDPLVGRKNKRKNKRGRESFLLGVPAAV